MALSSSTGSSTKINQILRDFTPKVLHTLAQAISPILPSLVCSHLIFFRELILGRSPLNGFDDYGADATGRIVDWSTESTNTTSLLLQNLTANQWYLVRVRAETGGGKGEPTRPLSVRIFLNARPTSPTPPHHHQPVNHEMQEDEPSTSTGFFIPSNKQHLGKKN